MQTKHSDVYIEYDERRNKWTADDDDKEIQLERNSLAELKKAIDDRLRAKQEGRFKRFTAIKKGRGWDFNKYERVMVTSLLEESRYGRECWISYEKTSERERAKREKIVLKALYADTHENREIMKVANDMMDHIENENKKLSAVEEKPEGLKIEGAEDADQ